MILASKPSGLGIQGGAVDGCGHVRAAYRRHDQAMPQNMQATEHRLVDSRAGTAVETTTRCSRARSARAGSQNTSSKGIQPETDNHSPRTQPQPLSRIQLFSRTMWVAV